MADFLLYAAFLGIVAAAVTIEAARRPRAAGARGPEMLAVGSGARLALLRGAVVAAAFAALAALGSQLGAPAASLLAVSGTLGLAVAASGLVELWAARRGAHVRGVALAILLTSASVPAAALQALYAERARRHGVDQALRDTAAFAGGGLHVLVLALALGLLLWGVPAGLVTLSRLRPDRRDQAELAIVFVATLLSAVPGTCALEVCYQVATWLERRLGGGPVNDEILHVTPRAAWEAAQRAGRVAPPSLAAEGFIHFSTPAQLAGTLARYYAGQRDLVALVVDAARFEPGLLRWERPAAGDRDEPFPHLYRALEVSEVVEVRSL